MDMLISMVRTNHMQPVNDMTYFDLEDIKKESNNPKDIDIEKGNSDRFR